MNREMKSTLFALGLIGSLSIANGAIAQTQTQVQQTDNSAGAVSTTGDGSLNPSAVVEQNFEAGEPATQLQTVPSAIAPSHSPSQGSPNSMNTFFNVQYPCLGPNGQIVLITLQGGANTPQYADLDGGSVGFSILGFGLSGGGFDGTTQIREEEILIHAGQLGDARLMAGTSLAQCAVLSDPHSPVGIATRQVLTDHALQMAGIYDRVYELLASQDVTLQNARQLGPHVMRQLNQLILINNDNPTAVAAIRADLNSVNGAMINLSRYSQGQLSPQGLEIDPSTEYSVILSVYEDYVARNLMERHLTAFAE